MGWGGVGWGGGGALAFSKLGSCSSPRGLHSAKFCVMPRKSESDTWIRGVKSCEASLGAVSTLSGSLTHSVLTPFGAV